MNIRFPNSQFVGDVNWLTYGGVWVSNPINKGEYYIRSIEPNNSSKYKVKSTLIDLNILTKEEIDFISNSFDIIWEETLDWYKAYCAFHYVTEDCCTVYKGNNYQSLFKLVNENIKGNYAKDISM